MSNPNGPILGIIGTAPVSPSPGVGNPGLFNTVPGYFQPGLYSDFQIDQADLSSTGGYHTPSLQSIISMPAIQSARRWAPVVFVCGLPYGDYALGGGYTCMQTFPFAVANFSWKGAPICSLNLMPYTTNANVNGPIYPAPANPIAGIVNQGAMLFPFMLSSTPAGQPGVNPFSVNEACFSLMFNQEQANPYSGNCFLYAPWFELNFSFDQVAIQFSPSYSCYNPLSVVVTTIVAQGVLLL
jgi:hypothetical protein